MKDKNNQKEIKRYAFIDVQNTASTTEKLLGFVVDWRKLFEYLKSDRWNCDKVFFYSGIEEGDEETAEEFDLLLNNGCDVKTKTVFSYKKPNKKVNIKCVSCGEENIGVVDMGYNKKSNCDVDLTVDAMDCAEDGVEFLIFTGDGDFEYLVKNILDKGVKVYLVSSNKGIKIRNRKIKRFAKKLKELVNKNRGRLNLIEINNLKKKIKKDI